MIRKWVSHRLLFLLWNRVCAAVIAIKNIFQIFVVVVFLDDTWLELLPSGVWFVLTFWGGKNPNVFKAIKMFSFIFHLSIVFYSSVFTLHFVNWWAPCFLTFAIIPCSVMHNDLSFYCCCYRVVLLLIRLQYLLPVGKSIIYKDFFQVLSDQRTDFFSLLFLFL